MYSDVLDTVRGASDDELLRQLRELDAVRRQAAAEEAAVLAELEARQVYRADEHATMYGLLRATLDASEADCRQRMRLARFVAEHPEAGEALWECWASVANIDAVAQGWARVRDRHLDADGGHGLGALLRCATLDEHDRVRSLVGEWVQRISPAQSHADAREAHEARNAHVHVGAEGGELAARLGQLDAIAVGEIFGQYLDAEWRTDWDDCRERYGDQASSLLMPRTDAQRRADALVKIFLDAASRAPGSRAPEPVVNIHLDHATFTGLMVEAGLFPDRNVDPFDDPTPHLTTRRCRSEHGEPVDPYSVLQLLLEAHVRYVVLGDDGVPIRWGRSKRLFEGAARDAVRVLSDRCTQPGCRVPTRRTETDHLRPWAVGGATDPDNGGPCCKHHNLTRTRGYSVHRDSQGRWHTRRPDGTPVR